MILENITSRYQELQSKNGSSLLTSLEQNAFEAFNKMGIPTVRHEEWKYTRISGLFNTDFKLQAQEITERISLKDIDAIRLPEHLQANELVFINGRYSSEYSNIRSEIIVMPLDEAANGNFKEIVAANLGHSSKYIKDGMQAMNTAFAQEGVFIHISKGQVTEHPVYIYNITDARSANILSQPRILINVSENAQVKIVETYSTIGRAENFTNQVMELVLAQDSNVEYYKVENDSVLSNLVSTTHVRQTGKSYFHAVTISLNGGVVRNNFNVALEAERCEAHLYGLYFIKGNSHVDNHTIVDNVMPNCLSNELYKGVIDGSGTAVFNGKIYVQKDAQKTNAFQSNKNILLSEGASVNTKPQLEIFADDVKCSHGCTVGQLDDEGLFYLRSRGINEDTARSMLVHGFAMDILEHIKPAAIRDYVDQLISTRLEYETA